MSEFQQKKELDDEASRRVMKLFQELDEKGQQEAIEYALSLLGK